MFGHEDNGQVAQQDAAQTAPATGAVDDAANNMEVTTVGAGDPAAGFPPASEPAVSAPEPVADPAVGRAAAATAAAGDDGDLLTIKQQALQQLSPLVGHLDQTAEEKFRTTMMMIQASDNQALIKDAYAAAQAIEDEKTRAQALLDIINEINYFTQQQQS